MKFAFSNLACPAWSWEKTVETAQALGYEGLELRLLDGEVVDPLRDAQRVVEAVELCRQQGLELCAFDTSCRFNITDRRERDQQVADLKVWIELAGQTRVPLLRVFGGSGHANSSGQQSEQWVVEALQQVALVAEQADVTLALETHDAFSSARRVAHVLGAVASPAVAALWDSHHPFRVGETVEEAGTLLAGKIVHVHVKDARKVAGEQWELVLLGEGEVPVREQMHWLKVHGYSGYVSVEWEKKWHPEIPDPEIALPQHIHWLRHLSL